MLKGKVVASISFILILFSFFVFSWIRGSQYKEHNKKLQQQMVQQSNQLLELGQKIQQLQESQVGIQDEKTCTYTQTFLYIEDYAYQGDVEGEKFIIVDQFQVHSPMILKIQTEKFPISFEKGNAYEFTFYSSIQQGIEYKKTIQKIEVTDKVGLEQTQETCRID